VIGHLTHTLLTVHRPTSTDDGMGGQTVTFSEVGNIRAQVNQPTAEERMLAQQAGVELSHVLHAVAGVDVRRGDELAGDLPSGVAADHRLRVAAVVSNSRSTYTRIECEVVQVEGA
jgi:head-tail adaptor